MIRRRDLAEAVPFIVLLIAAVALVAIPFRVMGMGFLPYDDAMRHVAKSMSGKAWEEILILRPGCVIYGHPGYHLILGAVSALTGCGKYALLIGSIIVLFLLFAVPFLFFSRRPEAWLAALFTGSMVSFSFIMRLFFGRPYIITIVTLMALCFIWRRFEERRVPLRTMLLFTALMAFATWVRGSWYLFILPLGAFALTGRWRAFARIGTSMAAGTIIGAALTGKPVVFLWSNLVQGIASFSAEVPSWMMATEVMPSSGSLGVLITAAVFMLWRAARGTFKPDELFRDPVFIMALSGWTLGFFVYRFWLDWGMPAALVWMAGEFAEGLAGWAEENSPRRIAVAAVAAIALFGAVTADVDRRWSAAPASQYLSAEGPEVSSCMPGPGGTLYSSDSRVFFLTFFKYPQAGWRYLLGPEAPLMPEDDLKIYRSIQASSDSPETFGPWIAKMRPEDRLILPTLTKRAPEISGLDWTYIGSGFWSGRLNIGATGGDSEKGAE